MKIKIELDPYNAISILSFIREFINEENEGEYKLKAIHEAVDELQDQLGRNLTEDQWNEINMVNQLNQLIGKSPEKKINRK